MKNTVILPPNALLMDNNVEFSAINHDESLYSFCLPKEERNRFEKQIKSSRWNSISKITKKEIDTKIGKKYIDTITDHITCGYWNIKTQKNSNQILSPSNYVLSIYDKEKGNFFIYKYNR